MHKNVLNSSIILARSTLKNKDNDLHLPPLKAYLKHYCIKKLHQSEYFFNLFIFLCDKCLIFYSSIINT